LIQSFLSAQTAVNPLLALGARLRLFQVYAFAHVDDLPVSAGKAVNNRLAFLMHELFL
jgi:hypothetical protein